MYIRRCCSHLPTKPTVSFTGRTTNLQMDWLRNAKAQKLHNCLPFSSKQNPGSMIDHSFLQYSESSMIKLHPSLLSGKVTLTVLGQHKKTATQSALHISGRFYLFILTQSSGTVSKSWVFQVKWSSITLEACEFGGNWELSRSCSATLYACTTRYH